MNATSRALLALCLSCSAAAAFAVGDTDRERLVSWAEAKPVDSLKASYMRCAAVSNARLFSMDEAAVCSTIADALLKKGFSGDFDSQMAWWRSQPQPQSPSLEAELESAERALSARPASSL